MVKKEEKPSVLEVFKDLKRMIKNGVTTPSVPAKEMQSQLSKDHLGYVLITCNPPTEKGKMEVELSFGGEENLAAYLVDSAQAYFDEKAQEDRG